MASWFRELDDLLRGRRTAPELLAGDRIDLSLRAFVPLAVAMGAGYGFFMGWYAAFTRDPGNQMQMVAAIVKLPALFLLTLVVTFPSLYVFNALMGCRLSVLATLRLLIGAIVVNLTVAASLGPILGFFTLSTTSYPFMVLLNVALLAFAGIVALTFLLHALRRLSAFQQIPTEQPAPAEHDEGTGRTVGPIEPLATASPDQAVGQAQSIFRIWVLLYGIVGAQMGWLLRPFIGSPDIPFTWFRERHGNVLQAVVGHLERLLSG